MATYVCPKCDIILKKGSWELFTACPDCGTPWPAGPDAARKSAKHIQAVGGVFALLSAVPYVGMIFGILGIIWGGIAMRSGLKVWGLLVVGVSVMVGLGAQSAFMYHEGRRFSEWFCRNEVNMMASSIREYREKTGEYPDSLDTLEKAKYAVPRTCLTGPGYFYLPPYAWRMTTMSSTAPAATQVGFGRKGDAVVPAAEGHVPESWKGKLPAYQARVFRAASMPASFATSSGEGPKVEAAASTLMVAELQEAHQDRRTCVMADLSVRSVGRREFAELLAMPQNAVFARLLPGAITVSTQPAPKKKKAPPSSGH